MYYVNLENLGNMEKSKETKKTPIMYCSEKIPVNILLCFHLCYKHISDCVTTCEYVYKIFSLKKKESYQSLAFSIDVNTSSCHEMMVLRDTIFLTCSHLSPSYFI